MNTLTPFDTNHLSAAEPWFSKVLASVAGANLRYRSCVTLQKTFTFMSKARNVFSFSVGWFTSIPKKGTSVFLQDNSFKFVPG